MKYEEGESGKRGKEMEWGNQEEGKSGSQEEDNKEGSGKVKEVQRRRKVKLNM